MYSNRYRRVYPASSSDSESDVEVNKIRHRRLPQSTAAPASSSDKKKKKKKRLPPQESIDKIWERFSQTRFSKAMSVLPFAPVAPSPLSDRTNELLSRGYECAADECRRKVRKIIQECRRVNMRYRDPGWDIDWDLKMGRGNCLNGLGKNRFDLSSINVASTTATVPKAVKRVHEIFEKPTFLKSISGSDIKQGTLGDCWFISCASGLANVPGGIQRICVEYDTKIGIYGFVFYRDGEWIYSIIDDKLYLTSPCWDSPSFQRDLLQQIDREDVERVYRKTYQTGSKALFFAQNKDQNETWLPLMEKAYAKAHGDYGSLIGGWIGEGIEDLTGGVTTELLLSDVFDTDSFWNNEISRVNDEFFFGCSTGLLDGGTGDRDGIKEGHAYNIMEARTLKDGRRLLKVRNPWGKMKRGIWKGAWSDGAREWTPDMQEEIGHSFGNDSVFWISYEDFLLKFQHIDRTRLFREPDWRCCQRWISVDVPWRTAYNEKFHIKLAAASPLVIVLSQLDTRYFDGLVGQYFYRLHFRLHEQGSPDSEDYIVRSHGNYLMNRSVSVDLPHLEAGNYSVFLSVQAWRDHNALSVEDIVKRELKAREENEKLAQVGQAYDLAHSKAATHIQELERQRKKMDQAKASDERKTGRRKTWAKRHLLKDIQRRQQAKNEEKKKKREAEREAERKRKEATSEEEPKPKDQAIQTGPAATASSEAKSTPLTVEKSTPEIKALVVESGSASTSGRSTPIHTPLDTPKSETVTELVPNVEALDRVVIPPISDVPGTLVTETEKAVSGTGESSRSEIGAGNATKTADSEVVGKVERKEEKKEEKKEEEEASELNKQKADKDGKQKSKSSGKKKESSSSESSDEENEDDSSDSPIEDWEEWYSSDNLSTNSIRQSTPKPAAASKEEEDSDEEKEPAPWNAICIVGIRVYSKDEELELRVVVEGGNLSEGGMGEKGGPDLDNAQANAGGQRVKESTENSDKGRKVNEDGGENTKDKKKTDRKTREGEQVGIDENHDGNDPNDANNANDATNRGGDATRDAEKTASDEDLAPCQAMFTLPGHYVNRR